MAGELPQTGYQFNTLMPATLPQTGFQFNSLLPPQQAPIALNAPAKAGGSSMGWVGPAIEAGGVIGGAAMGGKAQKQAAEIQAKTSAAALDFAKQQEAAKQKAYSEAMDLWKQQWMAQQARRDALLASYGFSVPSTPMPAMSSMSGAAGAPTGAMPPLTGQPRPGVAGVGAAAPIESPQLGGGNGTLGAILRQPTETAGLGNVFDWKKYGLA